MRKYLRLRSFTLLLTLTFPIMMEALELKLPLLGPEQKSFAEQLKRQQYSQALSQWAYAYEGTNFSSSSTGQALFAFLLFTSGLESIGLEKLSYIQRPHSIDPQLAAAWRKQAPPGHLVWKVAQPRWTLGFRAIFQGLWRSQSLPFEAYSITSPKVLRQKRRQLKGNQYDPQQKAHHQMQWALWDAIYDQGTSSLVRLDRLSEGKNIDHSRLFLNRARVLFQQGRLAEALESYQQVKKSSDYWLEAVEEKAWTYLRQKQNSKALGQIKTLMAPVFRQQVGPEPFFLSALAHLKVCDYPAIFKDMKRFKKTFRKRLHEIQKLARTGNSLPARTAVSRLSRGPYRLRTIANEIGYLPRLFHRDLLVKQGLRRLASFRRELQAVSKLPSPLISTYQEITTERAEAAQEGVMKRLRVLAQLEVKELKEILHKMQILEAEVIQRIYRRGKAHTRGRLAQKKTPKDSLTFPSSKEIWMDELDHYQVSVRDCPGRKGGQKL